MALEIKPDKPMTLREFLNLLDTYITDDFTEEQLLELPVDITIPHASGTYSYTTHPKKVYIKEEKKWSNAEQRDVITRTVYIDTNVVV